MPKPSAKSAKARPTRTRIIDAAIGLIRDQRGSDVTMADIAKASDLSRQAVYLHFKTRAELMVAALAQLDDAVGADEGWATVGKASGGIEHIEALVGFWGAYLPQISGVARAILAMREADKAARAAWDGRMEALREACEATVRHLDRDGQLADYWRRSAATDLLWSMLSFDTWNRLTHTAGWTQAEYIDRVTAQAILTFVGRSG